MGRATKFDSHLLALRLFLRVQAAASASRSIFSPAGLCRPILDRPRSSGVQPIRPSYTSRGAGLVHKESGFGAQRVLRGEAKNLDVMGFEPMTSGLEPASLTTGSIGSLFENKSSSRPYQNLTIFGRGDLMN